MTSSLLLVILLGAAQHTGQMSPTSDVSSNRVKATGASTSRALRDWASDVNGSAKARVEPVVARIPVRGAKVARSLALRAVLQSRATFGGIAGVEPDGSHNYNALWIRDYYHAVKGFPGYFTASSLRSVVDGFAATIGGDAAGPTAPAERLATDGSGVYRPGTEWGPLPVFDSAPYLGLLIALTHERGDSTVFATHLAAIEAALAGAPRDASGRIYSDPSALLNGHATVGWGFEDSISGLAEGLGMVTALHAWAYRRLEAAALDSGNTAAARRLRDAGDALIVALRTLRRSDGFYKSGSSTAAANDKHAILTALIVAEGLCSSQEANASAVALLAEYRKGTITQRGGIRHLVSPLGFVGSVPSNSYQNGAYWLGEWTDWVARSFVRAGDSAAARQLIQEAVDEFLREHRIDAQAPWEWFYNSTRSGPRLYGAHSATFVNAVEDESSGETVVRLGGALNSEVTIPFPSGHSLLGAELFGPSGATTVTVTVYAANQTAAMDDPINAATLTFASEAPVATVSLASEAAAASRSGWTPEGIFGGYLRIAVTAGSAASDLTVRLITGKTLPAWMDTSITDSFGADTSASFDASGAWTIVGGRLKQSSGTGASTFIWKSLAARDMQVSATMRSAEFSLDPGRIPEIVLRYVDASNLTYLLMATNVIRVYDLIAGVPTMLGNDIVGTFAANNDYTVTVSATGNQIRVVVGGVAYTRTTARTSAGRAGLRTETLAGTTEVQFDDFSFRAIQPIPPGVVGESSPNTARVAGEAYSPDVALRDDIGSLITSPGTTEQLLAY